MPEVPSVDRVEQVGDWLSLRGMNLNQAVKHVRLSVFPRLGRAVVKARYALDGNHGNERVAIVEVTRLPDREGRGWDKPAGPATPGLIQSRLVLASDPEFKIRRVRRRKPREVR